MLLYNTSSLVAVIISLFKGKSIVNVIWVCFHVISVLAFVKPVVFHSSLSVAAGHILEGFFGASAPVGPSSCPSNNVENSIFAPENGPL